mmetsp:Transcript_1299/g.3999  ORF Transcript_1299/g.3999 Transcript_1299/m.3999 type:complete len:269 (+) Transcript_1299:2915-3721(+)
MDPPPLRQFFFVAASVAGLDGAALSSEPSVPQTQRRAATTPAAARPVLASPAAPYWNCKRTLESTIAVEAIIARMQPVWEHFETFHHECRKTRLLSDAEIETLCKAATGFVDCVRVSYPDNHIELKLHVIEAHVPAFVRKWRSAGLLLEEGIEQLHAVDKSPRAPLCVPAWRAQSSEQTRGAHHLPTPRHVRSRCVARRTAPPLPPHAARHVTRLALAGLEGDATTSLTATGATAAAAPPPTRRRYVSRSPKGKDARALCPRPGSTLP